MKHYQDIQNNHLQLMMWETNPKLRNTNNKISFNLKKERELSIGDIISVKQNDTQYSNYKVLEIIEIRQSSLKDYNYCTCKIEWGINLE